MAGPTIVRFELPNFMGVLEPNVIPGLDRALLELFLIFGAVLGLGLLITVGSVVGLIRAVRRRKRGEKSLPAILLALIANGITLLWLCYWIGVDIYNRSNPINALLAINASLCLLPLTWLVAAIRANRSLNRELVSR
jgi:vacuolar-type H+-ATPase subunit I/STV1